MIAFPIFLVIGVATVTIPHGHKNFIYYSTATKTLKAIQPGQGSGSAFLLTTPTGKVVTITNYHVCKGLHVKGTVRFQESNDEDSISIRRILYANVYDDICILNSQSGEKGLTLAAPAVEGDMVFVVGHPHGLPVQISQGYVVGFTIIHILQDIGFFIPLPVMYNAQNLFINSAPGSSGSPILNWKGDVVGILFAGSSTSNFITFAIPSDRILKHLIKLKL